MAGEAPGNALQPTALVHLKQGGDRLTVQFSPDGKWIITASLEGSAQVWDALIAGGFQVKSGQFPTGPKDQTIVDGGQSEATPPVSCKKASSR
jgi:hypothetical protein